MKRPASGFAALLLCLSAFCAGAQPAQATTLPVYQYKLFCQQLGKGNAVMVQNCETQEIMSYNQLRRIWRAPPAAEVQDRCFARNQPAPRTGLGSYVKFLNCIITNTGHG
ncbi:hypothetical protein ACETRX_27455 [Labrys portucalensis]|uniref:DUF1311 domain-containing protein n=1 Tax=Labrys neptuniae TaxID=376174 RepID=A0ABV3PT59_9HYPH|nr:hypothetical protein [Labrys neptuniae]MDT3381465.1 hypothetical protein [Labrys neptuniae]